MQYARINDKIISNSNMLHSFKYAQYNKNKNIVLILLQNIDLFLNLLSSGLELHLFRCYLLLAQVGFHVCDNLAAVRTDNGRGFSAFPPNLEELTDTTDNLDMEIDSNFSILMWQSQLIRSLKEIKNCSWFFKRYIFLWDDEIKNVSIMSMISNGGLICVSCESSLSDILMTQWDFV